MLPFSFKEYYSLNNQDKYQAFNEYMRVGGFPYINQHNMSNEQRNLYMEGIYNTVLLKDIEERLNRKIIEKDTKKITDVSLLKSVSKYLSSVLKSPISIRSITNYFKSNERKVSPNTISGYLDALCESYLYYPVEQMDVAGKEVLKLNKKFYIVDMGIRNFILPRKDYDLGFTIENIVYLELLRRGYVVNVGVLDRTEVDFIVRKKDVYTYFQVTVSMIDKATFEREMRPLINMQDNYEKIILTLDNFTTGNYNGIKVINIIDWLLN